MFRCQPRAGVEIFIITGNTSYRGVTHVINIGLCGQETPEEPGQPYGYFCQDKDSLMAGLDRGVRV